MLCYFQINDFVYYQKVPISLAIRVASLRGTLRFFIKPPPADQLWYGFTFMPDIDFNLESSVGEHKITNTHIALFLINRLKVQIVPFSLSYERMFAKYYFFLFNFACPCLIYVKD